MSTIEVLEAAVSLRGEERWGSVHIRKSGFADDGEAFGPWTQEAKLSAPLSWPLYDWPMDSFRDGDGEWETPDESVRPLSSQADRDRVELALRRVEENE